MTGTQPYGIFRDLLLGCVGGGLAFAAFKLKIAFPQILFENAPIYVWIALVSAALIAFVVGRFITFILASILNGCCYRRGHYSIYYYAIAVSGNNTIALWSLSIIIVM